MERNRFFFSFFFYYSYVHTRLGSFLPPAPTPSLTTHSVPSLSPRNRFKEVFRHVGLVGDTGQSTGRVK
jgi:hypothetical protein